MRIVFVHLNSQLPDFLEENLKYCVQIFPILEIVLIHNQSHLKANLSGVHFFQYVPDMRWQQLESLYLHDKEFRNNFWFTSTARFFAIEEFMKIQPGAILHVESDVLLSQDFPFDKLEEITSDLAFPIISKFRGVASTLFIRNKNAAQLLTSNIIREVNRDPLTTEMIMLKKLYEENPKLITPLPIGPSSAEAYSKEAQGFTERLLQGANFLGGAVDGVDVGQYFFGTDPRNRRGKVILRRDLVKGFAKVKDWRIVYNKSRLFVDLKLQGGFETTRLYSLHLPVKRKGFFRLSKQSRLIRKYTRQSEDNEAFYFIPTVIVQSIFKSVARRLKNAIKKK
jgi:hypothetical protein